MDNLKYLKLGITLFISILAAAFLFTFVNEYRIEKAAEKLAHELKIAADEQEAKLKKEMERQRERARQAAVQQQAINKKRIEEQRKAAQRRASAERNRKNIIQQKQETCNYWRARQHQSKQAKLFMQEACSTIYN